MPKTGMTTFTQLPGLLNQNGVVKEAEPVQMS